MAIEALINRVRELHVLMENAATRADDPEKMLDTLKPLRHALLYVALTLAWFSDDKSVPPSKDLSLSHAALLLGLLVLRAVIDELDRASSEL
ncbi:MAG: hypothetical protein NTV49_12825 [Kiritimatiellaeota bacterium]|nr:hypothetical protein [Kiritimatiellota bacterium]